MGVEWEWFDDNLERAPIPNGWLVRSGSYAALSITFVPDKDHTWVIDK